MSLESLTIALHHSRSRGTAKLVLLGIANHDGDGGSWPSVSTLARYANVDRRNVQKAVAQLEALGEIRRVVQAGGDHRFAEHERPNRYEFLITCPPDCDRSRHHKTSRYRPVLMAVEDPLTDSSPPDGFVTPPLADSSPKPSTNLPTHKNPSISHLPKRAREKAACGHWLIDDRHCEYGCPIRERERQ